MNMEFRSWIALDELPLADESAWLPLARYLERNHVDLGPVVTWEDETTMVIVLADDQVDHVSAAERATEVVSDALRAVKLVDRVPRVLEVEPASDLLAA